MGRCMLQNKNFYGFCRIFDPFFSNFRWAKKEKILGWEVKIAEKMGENCEFFSSFSGHNSFPENPIFGGEKNWIFGLKWENWRNNVSFFRFFRKREFVSGFFSNFVFVFSYCAAIVFSFWTVTPRVIINL